MAEQTVGWTKSWLDIEWMSLSEPLRYPTKIGELWTPMKYGCENKTNVMPVKRFNNYKHMVRGGHRLPKVSPGPAMPYPSTPCGRATPQTALRPSSTPLEALRHTPLSKTSRKNIRCRLESHGDTKLGFFSG
jgi:hypothetical protein